MPRPLFEDKRTEIRDVLETGALVAEESHCGWL